MNIGLFLASIGCGAVWAAGLCEGPVKARLIALLIGLAVGILGINMM